MGFIMGSFVVFYVDKLMIDLETVCYLPGLNSLFHAKQSSAKPQKWFIA
jgi:hypothetical protein